MKTNVLCVDNYGENLPFDIPAIQNISNQFLCFLLNNSLLDAYSNDIDYSMEIMLCNNDFIHKINLEYRKIDNPTDVITFALWADSEDKIIYNNEIPLGQILISIDKTYSQAAENNISPQKEFLNLLAHGILHLFGIDHKNDNELKKMLELQEKMIASINYVEV